MSPKKLRYETSLSVVRIGVRTNTLYSWIQRYDREQDGCHSNTDLQQVQNEIKQFKEVIEDRTFRAFERIVDISRHYISGTPISQCAPAKKTESSTIVRARDSLGVASKHDTVDRIDIKV
jgi:hypothetical protein